jgi:hypothetical protein
LAVLLIMQSISSCTIEKRLYRNGWHVDAGRKNFSPLVPETKSTIDYEEKINHPNIEFKNELISASTEEITEEFILKNELHTDLIKEQPETVYIQKSVKGFVKKKPFKKIPALKLDELYRIMLIGAAFFIIIIGIYVLVQVSLHGGLVLFGLALFCIFVALAPNYISDVIVSMFREIGAFFLSLFSMF